MKVSSRLATIFALSATFLITSTALLLEWNWRQARNEGDWVMQSHEVQFAVEHTLSALVTMHASVRGFVISGDETFLAPHLAARAVLQESIASLRRLTAGNEAQQGYLDALKPHFDVFLSRNRTQIEWVRSGEREEAVAAIRSLEGELAMAEMRSLLARMQSEEARLLATRMQQLGKAQAWQRAAAASAITLEIVLAWGACLLAHRVARLRELVTICAWSKKVKVGDRWVSLEEYLAQVHRIDTTHGISPEERAKLWGAHTLPTGGASLVPASPRT